MDNFTNLNPQSNREWLMHINEKLDALIVSHNEDREDFERIINKWDDWKDCHDKEYAVHMKAATEGLTKLDIVEKRVNSWNVINSLGVIIAAILAALGLKSS